MRTRSTIAKAMVAASLLLSSLAMAPADAASYSTRLVKTPLGDITEATAVARGQLLVFVASFANDPDGTVHVFTWDLARRRLEQVDVSTHGAQANGASHSFFASADGRYVLFTSYASNLVGGDTNGADIFLRDRIARRTSRVSVDKLGRPTNGVRANAGAGWLSSDGKVITFVACGSDLTLQTPAFGGCSLYRRRNGRLEGLRFNGEPVPIDDADIEYVNAGDRSVAFTTKEKLTSGDNDTAADVYMWDSTGRISPLTAKLAGGDYGYFAEHLSADGTVAVVREGNATEHRPTYEAVLVEVNGTRTARVSDLAGAPSAEVLAISRDGRRVLVQATRPSDKTAPPASDVAVSSTATPALLDVDWRAGHTERVPYAPRANWCSDVVGGIVQAPDRGAILQPLSPCAIGGGVLSASFMNDNRSFVISTFVSMDPSDKDSQADAYILTRS